MRNLARSITIAIPVYNKKGVIKRALESAKKQKVIDCEIEILIIDDGSTDDCIKDIYEDCIGNVRLITQENGGVSLARNNAVMHAKHDLIMFLDADDELLDSAVEQILTLVEQFPEAGFYSGSYLKVLPDGREFLPTGNYSEGKRLLINNFNKEYFSNRGLIHSSSVCVKKNSFLKAGGFPVGERLGEDIYFWIQLGLSNQLAHYSSPISKVYKESLNSSGELNIKNTTPAYFVRYYTTNCNGIEHYKRNKDLRKLVNKLAFLSSIGAILSGSQPRAKATARCLPRLSFSRLKIEILCKFKVRKISQLLSIMRKNLYFIKSYSK